jgi:hypothetical protein
MTPAVYAAHVAAVPGPVLPLTIIALCAVGTVAWQAWHHTPAAFTDCWRLVADGWPRHVHVITRGGAR